MRRPGDNEPEPPGGRAAERLREFLRQHQGEGGAKEPDTQGEGGAKEPDTQESIDAVKNSSSRGPVQSDDEVK